MPKVTREQAESFREIAASAISSFVELGATKDEEAKLKKQIQLLTKSGMTAQDLEVSFRIAARDKDEPFLKQLKYARGILKA
ncbi:MAG: hypothetical protein OK456_08195 [Thaumarchaeota archaeon]|nr:hypothetical protein [Nitrososphaerota archaeon]